MTARVREWAGPLFLIESVDAAAVPEPAREGVARVLGGWVGKPVGPLGAGRMEKTLKKRYPYLAELEIDRSYARRSATAVGSLRRAVARFPGGSEWLDDRGVRFAAPAGLYDPDLPEVAGSPPTAELKALSVFLVELGARLPVRRLVFENAEDGWAIEQVAGPRLRWGDLRRTAEKLSRLSEVLADARAKYSGVTSADLRFFEDGRILLQPVAGKR